MKKLFFPFLLLSLTATAQLHWTQFNLPILPDENAFVTPQLVFDQNGNMVMVAGVQGVVIFNGLSIQLFNGSNVPQLAGKGIVGVQIDQNNKMWFLDFETLNLITYDGNTWTLVPQSVNSLNVQGFNLKMDGNGNLWSVVYDEDDIYNIAKFDGTGWTLYNSLNSTYYGYTIWSLPLNTDSQGRLVWCDGKYIHWFDGTTSASSSLNALLETNQYVTDVEIDDNDEVWIMITDFGNGMDKIAHFDGITWQIEDLSFTSSDYRLRMMVDDNGDIWVPASNVLWQKTGSGWQQTYNYTDFHATDIAVDPQNNWWFFSTDTISPSYEKNYLTILDQDGANIISGSVYFDLDTDGIQDTSEPFYPSRVLKLDPLNYYQLTDDDGTFQFGLINPSGSYDLSLIAPTNWYITSNPQAYSITQTYNAEISSGNIFGIAPLSSYDDATATVIPGLLKSGWNGSITVNVFNNGTTLMSGDMTLELDTLLEFVSSDSTPDQINGNEITWSYSGIFPGQSQSIKVTYHVPLSVSFGTIVSSTLSVTPLSTDVNPSDNTILIEGEVQSAYDPNIKTVFPEGDGADGIISAGTTLTYTVQFQNTGNSAAENVTVVDELDSNLDITTLQVSAYSHPYDVTIIEDHTLQFKFNNIQLPDSGSDEPASHGFIQYMVKPFSNVLTGERITNWAAIVFDQNEPVITNTTLNTIGTTTGTVDAGLEKSAYNIYPNPSSSMLNYVCNNSDAGETAISVFNMQGQQVLREDHASCEGSIAVKDLPHGIYQVRFVKNTEVKVAKFLKVD
jgi:uncharacterized repeat protein (TIGR01451 family)